jgi:hypothetical protein
VGAFAAAVTDYRQRAGALATALYPPAAAAAGATHLDAKLVAVLGRVFHSSTFRLDMSTFCGKRWAGTWSFSDRYSSG